MATKTKVTQKAKRGFASMAKATQLRICRMGGWAVSRDRAHMAEIGRLGGANSHGGVKK